MVAHRFSVHDDVGDDDEYDESLSLSTTPTHKIGRSFGLKW